MKTRVIALSDNHVLTFTCEKCEGEYLDTEVRLNGYVLCSITFADIDKFADDLKHVISMYRI